MAQFQPLAGLSSDETSQAILMLLAEIVDRLPRLDANDRAAVIIESSFVGVSGTVPAMSDLVRINNFGSSGTSRAADLMPVHAANSGAAHIYNLIEVS